MQSCLAMQKSFQTCTSLFLIGPGLVEALIYTLGQIDRDDRIQIFPLAPE
jgi:hypothetical protein